ncbi:MFS transporter [Haladaptatus cibarius]|uniref:MFS transporter n=1 Tax=Haladaptatus cibarius TaxID=453847 RepID=UPI0006799DC6|nr:MFS transporter [Haladaptatus cibarius]
MTIRTKNTKKDDTTTKESEQSSQSTWGLVAGASLISTGLAAYEIVPASVTPLIRDSLNIGPTIAGFLVGIMFGTAVIASLPVGAILDRTNTRKAMAFAVIILFIAGVWGWMAGRSGDYRAVIASRAVGGVAYVVVWNAGIDIVSRSVEESRRATAVGVFTASGPIGFALGQGAGPLIAAWFGWPAIFLAFNGIALVGLVLFWPTSRGLGHSSGDAPSLAEFGDVLRNKNVWLVGGLGFIGYSLYLFVNSWGSSYLTEEVGLSLALSGLLVAVFPAVGILARMSSGALSDRLFGGQRQPIVLGSFFITAPLVVGFTHLQSLAVLVAMLLIAGFAIQLTLGLSFTYVRELVNPRVAATAVAFQTSVGLAGAFIAPIAGGAVVDIAGFDTAFLVAGGLAALGVALAWCAPEPA